MIGVYTAEIEIASLSAAKTVMLLELPADIVVEILSAHITNMDNDSNEQLEAGLFEVTTIGSPTGTAVTPEPHEGVLAAGTTATGDLSAEPTAYNGKGYDRQGFSNLAGYRYDPIPEERAILSPSADVGLRLLSAPATAFKAACQIVFREIGG
jgi:hypothetical protein